MFKTKAASSPSPPSKEQLNILLRSPLAFIKTPSWKPPRFFLNALDVVGKSEDCVQLARYILSLLSTITSLCASSP